MSSARTKITAAIKVFGLVLAAALTACGGGQNNSSNLGFPVSGAPIPLNNNGSYRGIVTSSNGGGTIAVGQQTYNVATAYITENGQASTAAAIRTGSMVTISVSNGFVSAVEIHPVLSGPITMVNAMTSSFTALGQTVRVDANTVFSSSTQPVGGTPIGGTPIGGTPAGTSALNMLAAGNVVTVRGFVESPGTLVATRIDLISATLQAGARVYVAGIAQASNPTGRTFNLGSTSTGNVLNVSYATATNLGTTSYVVENTAVIVSSTSAPAPQFGTFQLIAQEVILFDGSAATTSVTFPNSGNVGGLPGGNRVRGIVSTSSFGQITVGGVNYNLGTAPVTEGGRASSAAAIRTGSLVTLNMLNSTTVSSVELSPVFTGPLDFVNAGASTLTGFGQTIRVDVNTVYNGGRLLANLTAGTVVTIGGYVQNNQLYATHVDYLADALTPGTRVMVAGTTQYTNASSRTFALGTLTVNYSTALNTPTITDNMPVVVSGTSAPYGNQFTAQEVAVFSASQSTFPSNPSVPSTGSVSVTGYVDAVNTASNVFSVLGIPFTVSGSTIYTNQVQFGQPYSLATMQPRTKVQITATPGTAGTYVAQQVTLQSTTDNSSFDTVTVSAPLTAVANPNMGVGTLQITTSATTQFMITGGASDANTFFSRATVGTYVNVSGVYSQTQGSLQASRVTM